MELGQIGPITTALWALSIISRSAGSVGKGGRTGRLLSGASGTSGRTDVHAGLTASTCQVRGPVGTLLNRLVSFLTAPAKVA